MKPRRSWVAWRVSLMLVAGAVALIGAPELARAQSPGLGLTLTTSQGFYYPGDTLSLSLSVDNTGLAATADFYAGVILPDGATVVTFGMDGGPSFGSLGNLGGLRPLATGVSLGAPFNVALAPFLQRLWTGTEPTGLYTLFLAAVRAGALADGRLDAGDLLGLRTAGMSFFRPAQATLETSQAASALIPPEGGTVTATSTSGITYALTVPAGAVDVPTTITLTPIGGGTSLPVQGRLVAAVRAAPEGARFRRGLTLAITVSGNLPARGLTVFTTRNDGTDFEFLPFTVAGSTLTLALAHFSDVTVVETSPAAPPCGARSEVGVRACQDLLAVSEAFARYLRDNPSGTPGEQQFLAQYAAIVLRWLQDFILPAFTAAAVTQVPTSGVDEAYDVAFVEYNNILALVLGGFVPGGEEAAFPDSASGSTDPVAQAIRAAEVLLPDAVRAGIRRANLRCDADRANYRQYLDRIDHFVALGLGGFVGGLISAEFGTTDQVTCLRVDLTVTFPGTVPADRPTTLEIQARLVFSSDGATGPAEPVVVKVTNVVGATVDLADAQGMTSVSLTAAVTPGSGATEVRLRVKASSSFLFFQPPQDILACVGSGGPTPARAAGDPLAQEGQCEAPLTVSPASVTLTPGQTRQFTAQVNGQAVPVTWSATGGTITPGGLYTAGSTGGTFVVTATSTATPSQSGTATVTVSGRVLQFDVRIDSQALLDSLAGVTEITGNFEIGDDCSFGSPCSTNSLITSLAPLASLRRIGGDFAISRASFTNLQTFSLPALTEIGGRLIISNTLRQAILTGSLLTVDLPALNNVGLTVEIRPAVFQPANADSIVTLRLPSLGTVLSFVQISDLKDLTSITLGAVQTGDNLNIFGNPALANLSAAAGGSVRRVQIFNNPLLPQSQIQALLDGITQEQPPFIDGNGP